MQGAILPQPRAVVQDKCLELDRSSSSGPLVNYRASTPHSISSKVQPGTLDQSHQQQPVRSDSYRKTAKTASIAHKENGTIGGMTKISSPLTVALVLYGTGYPRNTANYGFKDFF